MSFFRDVLYAAGAVISSPVWGWRLWRTGKWRSDWAGRFGHAELPVAGPGVKTVLIHAVSVGEVNAIRQLVQRLDEQGGEPLRILISTTTNTGTERARALFEPKHTVVRYPLDFTRAVGRFLDAVKPDAVALVELEVWPTFVEQCDRRQIPVAVVNGRLSARSFSRYKWIRPLVRSAFGRLRRAAVQDEDYAERFIAMGTPADRVKVTGTMKWDTAVIADEVDGADELAALLGIDRSRPLIVCGSSGPGEEKLFVETLGDLNAQLLIAPRKPERFDEASMAMGEHVRRSRCDEGTTREPGRFDRFLLDTIGELRKAYALADVAVIGRSFCPLYGSDMTEPIALGKATVIGPNVDDFRDMMAKLLAGDGILQVADAAALKSAVQRLLDADTARDLAERGRSVIRQQQGATDKHARLILDLIK